MYSVAGNQRPRTAINSGNNDREYTCNSRIMGEAAPLVVVGAAMILFDPEPLAALDGGNVNFTVIPIQIYFWTAEPDPAWHSMATASIALICLLVAMNSIAIVLRQHFRRRLNSGEKIGGEEVPDSTRELDVDGKSTDDRRFGFVVW